MKTSILPGLLAILMMMGSISSCRLFFNQDPEMVSYPLELSFQDASGNDLVKGIGLEEWCCPTDIAEEQAQSGTVKRDLYVLDITASELCEEVMESWSNQHFVSLDARSPKLGMNKSNGYTFLTTSFFLTVKDCPNEKMLTYKLKCPYVFGDDKEREFVTYWDIPKLIDRHAYAKCNRIEFEGKVITPELSQNGHSYLAVIILEGRNN